MFRSPQALCLERANRTLRSTSSHKTTRDVRAFHAGGRNGDCHAGCGSLCNRAIPCQKPSIHGPLAMRTACAVALQASDTAALAAVLNADDCNFQGRFHAMPHRRWEQSPAHGGLAPALPLHDVEVLCSKHCPAMSLWTIATVAALASAANAMSGCRCQPEPMRRGHRRGASDTGAREFPIEAGAGVCPNRA